MRAIKKINNNVVLCVDGSGKQVVALGKGIGFPPVPYDVNLDDITMTFYQIEEPFINLIRSLPEEVLLVSAEVVREAKMRLRTSLNPNLVVSLADHINFAVVRLKHFRDVKLAFSYDIQEFYPKETAIGQYAVKLVQKTLHITLPPSEVTAIAVHIINAETTEHLADGKDDIEALIDQVTGQIEKTTGTQIERDSLNYHRFVTHLRYYISRVSQGAQASEGSISFLRTFKDDFPELHDCATKVAELIAGRYQSEVSENEVMYLALHINRMMQSSTGGT